MYDLDRFLTAQSRDYATALREIQNGRKRSHWIWYIFPQVAGLGMSSTSQYYAISGLDEARAYLREPTLRAHLLEISNALLALDESDPSVVFGFPDDLKLRSSMTLFAAAAPDEPLESAALRRVQQRFDIARVRVDDRVVFRQRVVAENGCVRRSIGCKAVFGGHLLQHPRRRRDIFMYIAVAMPGEYEHAFAAQVGRPVVLPFVRARAEQRQRAQ